MASEGSASSRGAILAQRADPAFDSVMTLQLPEVRHLERRDRADNSRGTRKLARHDARRVDRRPKRSPPHLGPERNKQRVAGLCHSSGDNDDVRIQNIEQIGNSGAEVARRVAHDLARDGVALLRGLVHRLAP